MSYIHWKKFALALTAFFWASCTSDSPTVVQPAYGVVCPPEGCGTPEITSSSSGTTTSPNIGASSSSLTKPVSRDKLTACTLKSYIYDTVECGHNTTTANNFYCKDGFECYQNPECDSNVYCHDKQGNNISYTEKEFYSKYFYCEDNYNNKNDVICYQIDAESL